MRMALKLSGGAIPIKIPNICCVIYYLTSNEVLMTQQAENGLQSRSSENGKTAVWHYGLKLH